MRVGPLAIATALIAIAVAGCKDTSVLVLASALDAGGGTTCMPVDAGIEGGGVDAQADAGRGPHGGTWPTFAHDAQRTSHADGAGEMHQPQIAWSMRMGGVLGGGQAQVGDVDDDGRPNVVAITGGRVTTTNPDGSTFWQGPLAGARSVLGIWNLDGTGAPEVVIDSSSGVQILDGVDGHVLTSLGTRLPATATFVPEGAGGILVLGIGNYGTLAGYDFRGGTTVSAPKWTLPIENQTDTIAADVDGDGQLDLVHPRNAGFEVLDPITGQVKYSEAPIGPTAYFYLFQVANVDGMPGDEIVAVDTSYFYSPPTGIYVLGVRNGALATLWSSTANASGPALGADFLAVGGTVADLDADGTMEGVYSQWDSQAQKWTTRIVDAATGTQLAALTGEIVQALADVDGDGKIEVVVRDGALADQSPPRSNLQVYDVDSRTSGPTPKAWTLANAHVETLSPAVTTRAGQVTRPVAGDYDPAPGEELFVAIDEAHSKTDSTLAVLRGDGTLASTWAAPQEVAPSTLWTGGALTAPSSRNDLLIFGDDGMARTLSSSLAQGAAFASGSYANWLGVYGLDANRSVIGMATSNRDLLWLDGTRLGSDGAPVRIAHVPNVVDTSTLARNGWPTDPLTYVAGPAPMLVAYEQRDTGVTLIGLDTAGIESWRTPLAAGAIVFPPIVYTAGLAGNGTQDVIAHVRDVNSLESIAIFDASTGTIVRSTPLQTIVPGGDNSTVGSLVDVNGDGKPDLVTTVHSLGAVAIDLSADPMRAIWSVTRTDWLSGTVASAAVSGTSPSLLRSGGNSGFGPYLRLSLDGTVVASRDEGTLHADGVDTNAAALIHRSPGATDVDMISAGSAAPLLSRVRRIAGDTLDTVWTVYVADGHVSSSPPADAFALHDPITFDADGDGRDDVAVGSDDGWIYGLRGMDGSLLFATDLGAPVAHLIAADVDLDPALELIASLADGRLVALDEPGRYAAVGGRPASNGDGGSSGNDGGCVSSRGTAPEPVHTGCACQTGGRGSGEHGLATIVAGSLGIVLRVGRRKRMRA